MKNLLLLLCCCSILIGCSLGAAEDNNATGWEYDNLDSVQSCFELIDTNSLSQTEFEPIDTFFDRSAIIERLQTKKANQEPLVVHVYVPLCDNEHQGIVPTTPSLGNGMSLRSNLYWATSGGTKAFFKKQADWKLIYEALDIDTNVLERVVFEKIYDGTKVYFVADAYRGDRMEETVNDYLAAISGNRPQSIQFEDQSVLDISEAADLIMFNGHNGVMDYIDIKPWVNKSDKRTDIVMNACVSYGYLQEEFMLAGGYPLVRSNSLLYPGAYVLEQIIDDWVAGIDEKQICLNAGATYCKKHDCGYGTKVYSSGW
jgi:hypothetical protein